MEQSRPSNKARVFKITTKDLERAKKMIMDDHASGAKPPRSHCTADKLNNMNKILETES